MIKCPERRAIAGLSTHGRGSRVRQRHRDHQVSWSLAAPGKSGWQQGRCRRISNPPDNRRSGGTRPDWLMCGHVFPPAQYRPLRSAKTSLEPPGEGNGGQDRARRRQRGQAYRPQGRQGPGRRAGRPSRDEQAARRMTVAAARPLTRQFLRDHQAVMLAGALTPTPSVPAVVTSSGNVMASRL